MTDTTRLFDRKDFVPGDRVLIEAYVVDHSSDDPRDVHLTIPGAFGPDAIVTVYPNAILGRCYGHPYGGFVLLPATEKV